MAMTSGLTLLSAFSLEIPGLVAAIGSDAEGYESKINKREKRECFPWECDEADNGQGTTAQYGENQFALNPWAHGFS